MEIPNEYVNLYKPMVFIRVFWQALPKFDTFNEAYEYVESIHEKYFGCRHYSSYNSFQTAKKRLLG